MTHKQWEIKINTLESLVDVESPDNSQYFINSKQITKDLYDAKKIELDENNSWWHYSTKQVQELGIGPMNINNIRQYDHFNHSTTKYFSIRKRNLTYSELNKRKLPFWPLIHIQNPQQLEYLRVIAP